MSEKKRRRRTGCITCRQRRVKCDETTPECQRCIAANVECAGYEQRRRINLRPQLQQASSHSVPSPAGSASVPDPPSPSFRADGLPLVGFPRNPRPLQRPHTRARDVLAYHQFLFRTLPVLFPEDDLTFWRDELCEESWETEYIYDTIMALGGLHRGILLLSTSSENDRNRGLDTKVIALQSYTKALQELSEQLPEAEKSLDILVGVFVLLAYFEVCNSRHSSPRLISIPVFFQQHTCCHRPYLRCKSIFRFHAVEICTIFGYRARFTKVVPHMPNRLTFPKI